MARQLFASELRLEPAIARRLQKKSGIRGSEKDVMAKKILAADDQKSMLNLYSRIFSGEGYSVDTAKSFEEASGLIEAHDYDLLVTDLIFPDGLGTELIRLFEKKSAGAKGLLVTGASGAEEIIRNYGITGYLSKPFRIEHLLFVVTRALNS